jgi:alkaline phosphatase D
MITRRSFLAGGLSFLAVPQDIGRPAFAQALRLGRLVRGSPRFQSSPFTLGVASGDPAPDGVVLWTRLAPDPLNGGGMPPERVDVTWHVASDDRMQDVVRTGTSTASPAAAHSVHVEVTGLRPDRPYWYRFRAGNELSPIGRTRTLPVATAAADRLRFAFVSCQNYEMGYFTPLHHLAGEDIALVFHLGDYIYESAGRDGQIRRHGGGEARTLEEYRNRYAQYKTDPDLQEAHAAFPWVATWDDHEVDNDYAGSAPEQAVPIETFLRRRADAYQAYYEHVPLRRRARPRDGAVQLYRGFSYGRLASFFVLDTRQYRSDQPCGGAGPLCAGARDPRTTMLGAEQERWLFDGLRRSSSRWNVIPQQVMMARVDRLQGPEERYSMDHWNGYDAARARLLKLLATERPGNPVILTGDVHSHWVNDIKLDFDDPKSPTVATELVGSSISSGGDGVDFPDNIKPVLAENAFVKFYNGQRGYVACDVSAKLMRADFKVVDYVSRPEAPAKTRASFVIEDGKPGAVGA